MQEIISKLDDYSAGEYNRSPVRSAGLVTASQSAVTGPTLSTPSDADKPHRSLEYTVNEVWLTQGKCMGETSA